MVGLAGLPVRDTPHWWEELIAIPDVEDPRRLAWKIHASFLILVVRYEALLNQDYTMSPAPKCLTRGRFLPDDLSGPPKERKMVGHQDATADELAEKDLAEGHLYMCNLP